MDKIIYTCNAEHIGFIFPKRKWWNFSKKPREVRLEFVERFSDEEVGIFMRIQERATKEGEVEKTDQRAGIFLGAEETPGSKRPSECSIWIPPAFRDEILQEFIKRSRKKKRYDTLMVIDPSGSSFPDLLVKNVEDINYLAVLTGSPYSYEYVLDELAREFGLFGMIFTQYRDFVQYQRRVCAGKSVIVFMGENCWSGNGEGRRVFFRFPKGSLVLDFDGTGACQKMLRGERMENDYATLAIFLDNIVKNRYNSVVNEGLQIKKGQMFRLQQNVSRTDDKNKLGEKRKGIKKWKKRRIS